jgi:hypothetical protein
MKPEHKLTTCYADLLTESSDDALEKLIQELDTMYTAPARPAGLSWAAAKPSLELVSQQKLNAEARPQIRPLRLGAKQGRKKALLAVAAIVVLTLLSAALLRTTGASWFRQNQTAHTSPSLSTADALLLQQLLQNKGTPANIQQLAQSGQFTDLNLTKATDAGNVVIQKVYADANNVVLVYTVDRSAWEQATLCDVFPPNPKQCQSEPVLTVTTSEKQTLTENAQRVDMGPEPVYKNQRVAVLAYYDASSIQGHPTQLQLSLSLSKKVSPSQEKIGEFTVPFHGDKTVIAVNQTAISHGDALTLEQVVITPTEIRFYNKSSPLDLGGVGPTPVNLSIAGKSYDSHPFPASTDGYGWFGPSVGNSVFVSFYDSLHSQAGIWRVTLWARVWNGTYLLIQKSHADTWTFTFTVS